jgi:hypothetical protein
LKKKETKIQDQTILFTKNLLTFEGKFTKPLPFYKAIPSSLLSEEPRLIDAIGVTILLIGNFPQRLFPLLLNKTKA